jgi:RNA polymerase sigma factor (sigma-70 family)
MGRAGMIYEELLIKYEKLGYKFMHEYSNMDEEEVLHIFRMTIYKTIPKFKESKASYMTYLYTAVRNNLNAHFRKISNDKRKAEFVDIESWEGYEIPDEAESCASLESIFDYFKGLTEQEKYMMTLYYNGYGQAEIGKRVGVSQAQISRLLRGISKKHIA